MTTRNKVEALWAEQARGGSTKGRCEMSSQLCEEAGLGKTSKNRSGRPRSISLPAGWPRAPRLPGTASHSLRAGIAGLDRRNFRPL